jgi:hypothetical protein
MGSRVYNTETLRRALLRILALSVASFVLTGCPPPKWLKLKFDVDGKQREYLTIPLTDRGSSLRISGVISWRPLTQHKNSIWIFVQAHYAMGDGEITFQPAAMKLLCNGILVETSDVGRKSHSPAESTLDELVSASLTTGYTEFLVDANVMTSYDDRNQWIRPRIDIVINDYVFVDGKQINCDTLRSSVSYDGIHPGKEPKFWKK